MAANHRIRGSGSRCCNHQGNDQKPSSPFHFVIPLFFCVQPCMVYYAVCQRFGWGGERFLRGLRKLPQPQPTRPAPTRRWKWAGASRHGAGSSLMARALAAPSACAAGTSTRICPPASGRKIAMLTGAPWRGTTHNSSVRLAAICGSISPASTRPPSGFQYAVTVGAAALEGLS